jgi:prepilin-type N-terminal cleavage/methylation domain-containing protein
MRVQTISARRGKAFTLIEVLIALFLLVMCAFIVSASMPIANASRSKANDLNKAMSLAQKEMEAIRGVGYPGITPDVLVAKGLLDSATAVTPNTYSFTNSDKVVRDNPARVLTDGTGQVKIEQLDIDLKRVTVTVTWRERAKRKSFTVATLVANL